MSLIQLIKSNRIRLEEDLRHSPRRWCFSPARWLLRTVVIDLLRGHIKGDVLDVGCGQMPFRIYLEKCFTSYDGLDLERRSPHTLYLGDAQDMNNVPDNAYDTVISVSVLEHLPHPIKAIAEMKRVCRPGGQIIMCTPFLARLHEEPHDYFRYTHHALTMFAREQQLRVRAITAYGGIFTFLGHQFSTALIAMTWGLPGLRWAFFWLNFWIIVRPTVLLDRLITFGGKMPLGYFCVYEKPTDDFGANKFDVNSETSA